MKRDLDLKDDRRTVRGERFARRCASSVIEARARGGSPRAGAARPGLEKRPSASIGLRSTRRTRARFFCRCGRECMRYSARALSLGSEGHVSWERYERAGNPVSQWATYERYMGQWSQLAGGTFLGGLDPASGPRRVGVGGGDGFFLGGGEGGWRAGLDAWRRPVAGATGLCARPARVGGGGVPRRRCEGPAVSRRCVRCRRDAAGDLLRPRSGEGGGRDGAGGPAWRRRRRVRLGHGGRGLPL